MSHKQDDAQAANDCQKTFEPDPDLDAVEEEGSLIDRRDSPLRAIRRKCLDCAGDSSMQVAECDLVDCPLHPYRFGRDPYRPKKECGPGRDAGDTGSLLDLLPDGK